MTLVMSALVGCSSGSSGPTPDVASKKAADDATTASPRIVSIGAAVTETLFALGVGDTIVAIDRTSVHPEATQSLPKVGLPGQLSVEGIASFEPTLIIADGSATHGPAGPPNPALDQLASLGLRVERLGVEPRTPAAAARRIEAIGALVGKSDEAKALATAMLGEVDSAKRRLKTTTSRPRVLFISARGHRTLLVSGTETTAHELLSLAGADNAVTAYADFKPMSAESFIAAAPDVVVIPERGLASLGGVDGLFGLPGLADTPAGKAKRFVAIDDLELLSFGPRLGRGLDKLISALHGAGAP